jgi:hypothetical protein
MRTIFYTIIALLFTSSIYSQDKAALVDKVMTVNNGNDIFIRLQENNTSIPDEKKAEFKALIQKKADELQAEARKYFMKKYSADDLNEIYTELNTPGRISLSEKTLSFIREYRSYKIKFQKYFKEQYIAFQK